MDYESMTVQQLRQKAADRKIPGRAELNKEDLIAALKATRPTDERLNDLESRVAQLEGRAERMA